MSCQKYIPLMEKKWKKGGQRRDSRGGKKIGSRVNQEECDLIVDNSATWLLTKELLKKSNWFLSYL